MLAPKKLKMRKPHRPDIVGCATSGDYLAFGAYGLKATTGGWVKANQLEAARRAMTKFAKRGGKIWIRVFPQRPITSKGSQATMGGGKGAPDYYVAAIHAGNILFEMDGVTEAQAREAMDLAAYKLSVRTKFVAKN